MIFFEITLILFAAYLIVKSCQGIINDYHNSRNRRKPMETFIELKHHHWLMRTGMKEHANNFNGFGFRRTIRKRSSGGGIAPV